MVIIDSGALWALKKLSSITLPFWWHLLKSKAKINMLTKLKQDQKDCAKCFKPILEEVGILFTKSKFLELLQIFLKILRIYYLFLQYLTILMDKFWHEKCVYCTDCGMQLTESCYSRQGKIFCRRCFYK